VTKAKTPQERVREAVATEVARGGFELPEAAPPATKPVVVTRRANTPPPLPVTQASSVAPDPESAKPSRTQPEEPKPSAKPTPKKAGLGGMDLQKRAEFLRKAAELSDEEKAIFDSYRARLDKETWLLEELADADSDKWLGILEGALGQAPKANKQDQRKPLLVVIAIAAICLVVLGIGAAIKSSRSNQTAGALPTPTAVQVAPATQVASPTFVCEPVTPGLTRTHLGQPDPTHFTDSGKKTSGGPYVDCDGARILKNPDNTYNITYCRVCYPK
jgi:hypothetical protein